MTFQHLLAIHIAMCFTMTGLIWLVQLVHYPSFHFVDKNKFSEFHAFHSRRITVIVGPVMGVELVTAMALAFGKEPLWLVNLTLVLLLWALTVFISVPLHNKLSGRCSDETIDWLVRTNWLRTVLWTLRSIGFLAFMIATALP